MNNRLAEGYEPDFDIDAEVGRQGELWILSIRKALQEGRVEVKTDEMASRTQNIYIEDQCCRRDGWQPSGIATTEADAWVHVLVSGKFAFLFSVEFLRELYTRQGRPQSCDRGSHPTRGKIIPIGSIIAAALPRSTGRIA